MRLWSSAIEMAQNTPASRNRYVDFLRAVSILMVVTGHWLIAGFVLAGDAVEPVAVLAALPDTQWLTWLFQVMPIFFIVGGYSNAVSLESAHHKAVPFDAWFASRMDRLLRPVLPLIGFWVALAVGMLFSGVAPENVQLITRMALIPIWFLAIYTVVVMLAPLTYRAWQRYRMGSFVGLAAVAVLVDVAVFAGGFEWAGWTNYLWIWLAVHQLGYAWRAGSFQGGASALGVSVLAWGTLAGMVHFGPYPFAMVGSPDPEISNTLPPKLPLLALGIAQFALLLTLEAPVNRWLQRVRAWAATVLVNSMIMTLYLWHITVMLLVVFVAWQLGVGLSIEPGSGFWWYTRPVWVALLFAALLPIATALSPIERTARPESRSTGAARLVVGALLTCAAIALMSLLGLGATPAFDLVSVLMITVGAFVGGLVGLRLRRQST